MRPAQSLARRGAALGAAPAAGRLEPAAACRRRPPPSAFSSSPAAAAGAAPTPPTHPRVGVAISIFPRLPDGRVDASKMVLIKRGTPPGEGLLVFAGGKQELGETVAQAAAREAREELGLAVDVVDPACAAYASTDVLHPPAPPHAFHYAILHVLATVPAGSGGAGVGAQGAPGLAAPPASSTAAAAPTQLPRLTAASDAAEATWVDLTALLAEEAARGWPVPVPSGCQGGAAGSRDPPAPRALPPPPGEWAAGSAPPTAAAAARLDAAPPCLLALHRAGALVPLTVEVARLAVRQWALRGVPLAAPPPGAAAGGAATG